MWHSDDNLKDIVILDPIGFFVKPATIIICKHKADELDSTQHLLPVHKKYKLRLYQDYERLINNGIASELLLKGLLEDYIEHYDKTPILGQVKTLTNKTITASSNTILGYWKGGIP